MIHYYDLIEAGTVIDASSRFLRVGVGSGHQGTRDFLFLVAYAADNNFYFERHSEQSAEFLNKVAGSLNLDYPPIQLVTARDLVRSIKAGSAIPLNENQLKNADKMRFLTNINYRIAANIAKKRP